MAFPPAAFGLLLHLLGWGAGAAILLTPRPWRAWWPVFCAPMGLALQSAVVWAGVYAGLAGTQAYARGTELIPVLLLAAAWWRHGRAAVTGPLVRCWGLWVLVAADLFILVQPMARASKVLTTLSLGSCDAADYAAGARVLQEFAHADRTGFLGLTEVVRVASVDNFFDFWLRLNHFTPSALIAFNGAVFGWKPHEITGVLTALLLASSLPAVFWMARAVMRYSAPVSLWIAAIYGVNPITWYAVAHVAMGQLLAAHAIVFLTWVGVALWRGRLNWRRGWAMAGVLAMAYWLVLGSYNFIVVVCLVPVLTYAGGGVLLTGWWRRFGCWLAVMLLPLAACCVVFTQRALGLVERFQLFGQHDFGWHIPILSPEGWLGAVNGPALGPLVLWLRLLLSVILLVLLVVAMARDLSVRRRAVYRAVTMMLPVMVGYTYLELRGVMLGTNASYDAYKLLAVFFPGQLCGYCYWTTLTRSRRRGQRWAARVGLVGMTALNLTVANRFAARMADPPLIVDRDLVGLQAIEVRPDVTSINMKVGDFWSRLWANSFLLRKPQYFATHTYEGRINTALKGEWDLHDGVLAVAVPGSPESFRSGAGFYLLDTRAPNFLSARLGDGWYAEERIARAGQHWHWSKGNATLVVANPHADARTIALRLRLRAVTPRTLEVWQAGNRCGAVAVGQVLGEQVVDGIVVPPGETTLELRADVPAALAGPGDPRPLGVAAYGITVEVRASAGAAAR